MKFKVLLSDSDFTLYNIQFILLTYPSFFVDISSVLYEQPDNISVTISCSPIEWSVLQNIEKKNNEKV